MRVASFEVIARINAEDLAIAIARIEAISSLRERLTLMTPNQTFG
jgi:hypothetical protein